MLGGKLFVLHNAAACTRASCASFLKLRISGAWRCAASTVKLSPMQSKCSQAKRGQGFVTENDRNPQIDPEKALSVVQSYCKLLELKEGSGARGVINSDDLPADLVAPAFSPRTNEHNCSIFHGTVRDSPKHFPCGQGYCRQQRLFRRINI